MMAPLLRIAAAAVVAVVLLNVYNHQRIDGANLALGSENQSAFESWNRQRITASSPRDIAALVESRAMALSAKAAERTRLDHLLWLGNSQLHTINQFKPGDHLAPFWLTQREPPPRSVPLGVSLPNANVQEHLVLTLLITDRLPVDLVILKLVFDDMREDGLRADLTPLLSERLRERLAETLIGREILQAEHASHKVSATEEKTAGLHGFAQEYFEDRLVDGLGAVWPLWADRANLRNRFLVDLYELRNWVFGIKPSTVRPIIKSRYLRNMAAFEALAVHLKNSGIPLLVYIAPIRQDLNLPYEPGAYQGWIADIERLSATHGYRFLNLQRLVPDNLWGSIRKDDIDFMHFQGPGHRILADRLWPEIESVATGGQQGPKRQMSRP